MGAFFTNVQVHAPGPDAERVRGAVVAGARAWLHGLSYVEVADDEPADRTILVGPIGPEPWVAVYDEATEDQDLALLDGLAATMSTAATTASVGVQVHDSDVLDLRLFRDGQRVDDFCNWPGYFGGRPRPQRRASGRGAGHPSVWRGLLAPGMTQPDLRAAWSSPLDWEEASRILERMAPVVGWSSNLVTLGFRMLPEALRQRCIRLAFRATRQPVLPAVSALPQLGHAGGDGPEISARIGERATFSAIAHNTGDASRGLAIIIWGPALERGLVMPERVAVRVGAPETGPVVEATLVSGVGESGPLRSVTLPDLAIPTGLADPATAFRAYPGQSAKAIDAWLSTRIEVAVQATALRPGSADLHIGLVPAANPTSGQTFWTLGLRIGPA